MARTAQPNSDKEDKPSRGRRWLRRGLIAAAALVVLVWSAPYLASSGPGTALIARVANGRIRGTIHIRDLSLRWLGGGRVEGLTVTDPDGRKVLSVPRVEWSGGLLHAAWSWEDFDSVKTDSYEAVLYLADGKISLLESFAEPPKRRRARKRKPRKKREPSPPVQPFGRVEATGGTVRIVQADGRELVIRNIELHAESAGFSHQLRWAAELAGGRLEGEATIATPNDGTWPTGDPQIAFKLATPTVLDGSVLGAFAGRDELGGTFSLAADGRIEAGDVNGRFAFRAQGLRAGRIAGRAVEPIDLALSGNVTTEGDLITGHVGLVRGPDAVNADFSYRRSAQPPKVTAEDLLAAVRTGRPIDLPDFTFTANGRLDVPALARAIPALLRIPEGTEIVGGRVEINNVVVRGGSRPSASGKVQLVALASVRQGRRVRYDPIVAEFDTAIVEGTGLRVRRIDIGWGDDRFGATGDPRQLQATWRFDLSGLRRRLGQLIDLGEGQLLGVASGSARATLTDKRVAFELASRIEDDGPALEATAKGWYQTGDRTFHVEGKVPRARLDYLARAASAVGFDGLAGYGGRVGLTATADRGKGDGPIVTAGSADVTGLTLNAKPLVAGTLTARWRNLRYDPATRQLTGEQADITGEHLALAVTQFGADLSGKLDVYASLTYQADLPWCLDVARRVTGREDLPRGKGRAAGTLTVTTPEGRLVFDTTASVTSSAAAALELTAKGWFDPDVEGFHLDLDLRRADVAWLEAFLKSTGREGPARLTGGVARLRTTVSRASSDAPVLAAGSGTVAGLAIDGKPVGKEDMTFRYSGVEFDQAGKSLAVASAALTGPAANLSVADLRAELGEELRMDGKLTADADLARCLTLATPFAGWKKTPEIFGRLTWTGQLRTAGDTVDLAGAGSIKPFRFGTGDKAITEPEVRFVQHVVVDRRSETITVDKADLSSQLVTAAVSGTIRQFRSQRVLDLSGRATGAGERITALLQTLRPDLAGHVSLTGPVTVPFKLTGPAHDPKLQPAFRDLAAEGGLTLGSANIYGVPLSKIDLSGKLADGRFVLPLTAIDSDGGKVQLLAHIDLRPDEPVLTIPGKVTILDNIPINSELSDTFISRAVIILFGAKDISGRASLTTEDLTLPLGKGIKTAGAGRGRLDLKNVRIKTHGKALLDNLLKLAALPGLDVQAITIDGLDFEIRQGRIHYDNCTVAFGEVYDMKFNGSVGFDDTIQLTVWLPLTPPLLEKIGAGLLPPNVRALLATKRVPVFIGGTRQKPRLDFSRVDLPKLLGEVLPGLLGPILQRDRPDSNTLEDLLGDLLGGLSRPATQPATQPATRPADRPNPLGDLLDDLLRPRDK